MPDLQTNLVASVARRIKELRLARGLTQDALAEALGIATKNAQRIEAGRQNLTLKTLQQIATILDVEPYELLRAAGSPVLSDAGRSLERALAALSARGHQVIPAGGKPPAGACPVLTLEAAASRFGEAKEVAVSSWIKLKGMRASQVEGRFVAMVVGTSMVPTIPARALCLFRAPVVGPIEGRIVLAQWRDDADPDSAGGYVVKRVGKVEGRSDGRVSLRLLSDNRSFKPIDIVAEEANGFRLLALLERTLWPGP